MAKPHVAGIYCWCFPHEDTEQPGVWIHRDMTNEIPSQEAKDVLSGAWDAAMKEWKATHPSVDWYGSLGWPAVLNKHQLIFIDKTLERLRAYYEANERWSSSGQ